MDRSRLRRLLEPQSMAFVGGRRALLAMRQSQRLGYTGRMWLVNPTAGDLGGTPAHPALGALPGVPDLVFVAVDADKSVDVVAEAAKLGAVGAVAYASGFAEVGRTDRSEALLEAAGDMPVVGPNCHGFINALSGAAAWPDVAGLERVDRGVAILSQSGDIAINLTMQQRAIPISHAITLGNQAMVSIADCIDALASDERVIAIGMYVEGIVDSVAFAEAACQAHRMGTPIVALRSGATETGRRLVQTHTAALAGPTAAHRALFTGYGVSTVDTPEQLAATLAVLAAGGRLGGNHVVSISSSGGEAALMADRIAQLPIELPDYRPDVAARLGELFGGRVAVTNPLDYHTYIWGDREAMTNVFAAALSHADVGLLLLDWPAPGIDDTDWWPTLDAFCDAVDSAGCRGIVTTTLSENLPANVAHRLAERGVAAVPSLEASLAAIVAAQPVTVRSDLHQRPLTVVARTRMAETAAKDMLRFNELPVPEGMEASIAAAASAAAEIGFPVVVKATSPVHRSDVDGVRLGLTSGEAVAAAAETMAALGETVLVERQVEGVIAEVLVGVAHDAPVGWTVTLGAGGVLAELIEDTETLLLPANRADVVAALERVRIGRLLTGYRGAAAADLDAVIRTVLRLCDVAVEQRLEIEVNPLLVCETGAWIADVLAYELEVDHE